MKKAIEAHKKRAIDTEQAFRIALVSSRGQITIPQDVRDIMRIRKGSVVGFEPTKRGVLMVGMKVEPASPYTEAEWHKIGKLSRGKGKTYNTPEEAKRHIANL